MDQAVELLGRAVSVMPNIAVGWIELGAIFGAVGDAPLAQRCLRSALRIDRYDKIALSLMHEIQSLVCIAHRKRLLHRSLLYIKVQPMLHAHHLHLCSRTHI
jgi:predicted TPR repeat methyltransferase